MPQDSNPAGPPASRQERRRTGPDRSAPGHLSRLRRPGPALCRAGPADPQRAVCQAHIGAEKPILLANPARKETTQNVCQTFRHCRHGSGRCCHYRDRIRRTDIASIRHSTSVAYRIPMARHRGDRRKIGVRVDVRRRNSVDTENRITSLPGHFQSGRSFRARPHRSSNQRTDFACLGPCITADRGLDGFRPLGGRDRHVDCTKRRCARSTRTAMRKR
jgi:hypothetical protein